MPRSQPPTDSTLDVLQALQRTYLFQDLTVEAIALRSQAFPFTTEKLYSNRPVYTAFRPDTFLEVLYVVVGGGPVIIRSSPLDRVIAMTYPGGCFGMRSLPFNYGTVFKAFPSQVEAYKTTDVIKVPLALIAQLYDEVEGFRDRYHTLFELREKFQYHLLNCSTYPPQAVAALLRALIYQERALGSQPNADNIYVFDLPIDLIARACQLNHRTVEQVLKGMQQNGLLAPSQPEDTSQNLLRVLDPEGLKEVYSTTRDKVSWWPLR
jgi:hypothetical protein